MKPIVALAAALLAAPVLAQPAAPDLSAQVLPPYRGETIPLSGAAPGNEEWDRVMGQVWVRNVSSPALYVVRPMNGRSTGKVVIVVPGGGYQFVSIESEGFRVADRLAAEGHLALVLKYRPKATPPATEDFMAAMARQFGSLGKGTLADHPPAVDDLAAAIDYVHSNARKLGVSPDAIGVIGFSAGSRSTIRLLEQRPQAALLDDVALIYPPMTEVVTGGPRPPLFLAIASDDPLFRQGRLALVDSWLRDSNAVELHLYSGGSHGFGMMPKGTTSDHWIDQYLAWLALQ